MRQEPTLGIDVGGVILDRGNDGTDTSFFSENFLKTMPTPGMYNAVETLVARFKRRAYIVSKCGKKVQEKTLKWLDHHRFYERTGLPRENVRFCLKRPDKAPICAELGITHFVDDKLEVLSHMVSVQNRYLFMADDAEVRAFSSHLPFVTRVESWAQVLANAVV